MHTKTINRVMVTFSLMLTACSGLTVRTIPPAASPVVQSKSTTASQTAQPAATALPSATPNFTNPAVVVLAANLPAPDDLLVGPDGTIYVSDESDGTVRRITADGKTDVFLSGIDEPEGMVFLEDGSIIIAEQGSNRLLRWDAAVQALTPLLDLPSSSGKLGVDGIALDSRPGSPVSLIVPDSGNDRLLRVTPDGRTQTVIASGLARPGGAWVEKDGSILVVGEASGLLERVHPDSRVEKLASLPTPDDVVEDAAGNIFVNTLTDGAIHRIDGQTLEDHILVSGLANPQGLAIDSAGNLIVSDTGNHQVKKVMIYP